MRFFWILTKSLKGVLAKYLIWTGPQLCPKISLYPTNMYIEKEMALSHTTNHSKRNVFLFPSIKGSITVETALVLPLFLFFCIQLITIIQLFQIHSVLTAAMHQEVASLSLEAYACEKTGISADSPFVAVLGDWHLKEKVIKRAGEAYLDASMIQGGSRGIQLVPFSDIYEQLAVVSSKKQDEINMLLTYRIEPVADILGFSGFTMANHCVMKAWTGYKLPQNENTESTEELVYITENGVVYHKSRRCRHLALSIREVETDSLAVFRNESGEKYYACENCGKNAGATVFLTDQGNRYHTSLVCGGLKRTIYVVKASEVGGRGACSRCSGMS